MNIGRTLIVMGGFLVVLGLIFTIGDRLPFRVGRLPGDLLYRGKNTTLYFPIVTCIVISVLLTVVMWIVNRFR